MSPEEAADLIYQMAAPDLRESFWRTWCEIADAPTLEIEAWA